MTKSIRVNFIKLLTLVLAVCVGVAIATIPGNSVAAEEAPATFSVEEGIRIDKENDLSGIKFTTTVNDAWLAENAGEKYTFGTLVFPANNAESFDMEETDIDVIKAAVDGIKFVSVADASVSAGFSFDASIVFNKAEILGFEGVNEENIDAVLEGLYAKEFAAVSFAIVDGALVWADDAPVTSMVAEAIKALTNDELAEDAKAFIPGHVGRGDFKSYVSKEDGKFVIIDLEYDANEFANIMINGDYLGAEDYSVVEGDLVISAAYLENLESGYYDVLFFDDSGNIVILNVLFADKALKNADDVIAAFDHGIATWGETYTEKTGVYVLANDIDMTGTKIQNTINPNKTYVSYKMENEVLVEDQKIVSGDIGFNGILDGMGYAIKNATVNMVNHMPAYTNANGTNSWLNETGYGFFHRLKADSIVKNVAFINLMGTGTKANNISITGPLSYSCEGIIENVYVDVSADTVVSRGPIAAIKEGAIIKNYVVNYPRPEGYDLATDINTQAAQTGAYAKQLYAYGYGSLVGGGGGNAPSIDSATFENVLVVSPMPLYVSRENGDMSVTKAIYYGANETKLFYDHEGQLAGTVQDMVAAGEGRVKVLDFARRYNTFVEAAADTEFAKIFTDTGLFKIANGELLWHSAEVVEEISTAVDFDAAEGKLLTSVLDSIDVVSATVNGVEVEYADGKFTGVPAMDNLNNESQKFEFVIKTADLTYNFTNVTYWTSVINNAAELKAALDINYNETPINYGFYKLGNEIKATSEEPIAFDYVGASQIKDVNSAVGFNGIFDGAGYAIDFNKTWLSASAKTNGLFGNFNHGGAVVPKQQITVKNLAIKNAKGGGVPSLTLFGRFTKNHGYGPAVLFENIYVYGMNDVPAGLIFNPGYNTAFNNILVDVTKTTEFGGGYVTDAYGKNVVANQTLVLNGGYYGGILFNTLRYGTNTLANNVTNFVSIGKAPLVKQYTYGNAYYMWFTSTANGDGTYAHDLRVTGWNYGDKDYIAVGGGEVYMGYASGNRAKADVAMITGMKAGFAEIAKNYTTVEKTSGQAALKGYYCANCGEVFSLEAGNCTTCVVDETPVALTEVADLWRDPICYTWEARDLTTFTNGESTKNQGEMKFDGAYKYDTLAEMKASNNKFESFVGEAGNGLWAVTAEGELTWVGAQA
ncbi:MAG: hypothetical protein J6V66_01615 [Clostridia bacterium]|nr:hypothetical protein [Clostridia bacterium]